jgi:hypothetical protein
MKHQQDPSVTVRAKTKNATKEMEQDGRVSKTGPRTAAKQQKKGFFCSCLA